MLIDSENTRLGDRDNQEERSRIELSSTERRLELMTTSLSEAKAEVEILRNKNIGKEKKIVLFLLVRSVVLYVVS